MVEMGHRQPAYGRRSSQALGIDPHAVTRWIKSGHLIPKLRGTAHGPLQNGGTYVIKDKDVRRFILQHRPRLICAKSTNSGSSMWSPTA